MDIEKPFPEEELDILLISTLDNLTENADFILKASTEGRVDQKDAVEKSCSRIKKIAEDIRNGNEEKGKGLEAILDELNSIRELIEQGKIDPRSLVADRHLRMEALANIRLQRYYK